MAREELLALLAVLLAAREVLLALMLLAGRLPLGRFLLLLLAGMGVLLDEIPDFTLLPPDRDFFSACFINLSAILLSFAPLISTSR